MVYIFLFSVKMLSLVWWHHYDIIRYRSHINYYVKTREISCWLSRMSPFLSNLCGEGQTRAHACPDTGILPSFCFPFSEHEVICGDTSRSLAIE